MAATLEAVPSGDGRSLQFLGSRRIHTVRVTLGSAYPTNGEAVDFRPFGVQDDANAVYIIQQRAPLNAGYTFVYDRTNRKLLVFAAAAHTHTENTNATYVQNATTVANAFAADAEVPGGTDLSGVIVDVLIIGA